MRTPSRHLREVLKRVPGLKALNQLRLHCRRRVQKWRTERALIFELKVAVSRNRLLSDLSAESREEWEKRIRCVVDDPNNPFIPRHMDAGKILGTYLIMHNGVKVHPLSYYDRPMLQMLITNKGVHEPEEERAFQIVLPLLPDKPIMIELGSYWAFYSLWFMRNTNGGRCFMVEAAPEYMACGERNFKCNSLCGEFTCSKVASASGPGMLSMDDFVAARELREVHILHCDIQGSELEMLKGSSSLLSAQRIWFLFISTHSNPLHEECTQALSEYGYVVLRNTNLDKTSSADGLIVACSSLIYQKLHAQLNQLEFDGSGICSVSQ